MTLEPVTGWDGAGQLYASPGDTARVPVLLTHGTFSDASICAPLAAALAPRPVYVIEWRQRRAITQPFDYTNLAIGEMAHALRWIGGDVHLAAHSGGGLAFVLALHLQPALRAQVKSLSFLGTQATRTDTAPLRLQWLMRFARWRYHRRGAWDGTRLRLGPSDESAGILEQWMDWNAAKRFTDGDGQNVLATTPDWTIPSLHIAGSADTDIAPVAGVRAFAQAFGPNARFHLANAESDGEDFTHTRLIRSRAAARHLWPRIARFMDAIDAGDAAAYP